jgi:hypothetical protein
VSPTLFDEVAGDQFYSFVMKWLGAALTLQPLDLSCVWEVVAAASGDGARVGRRAGAAAEARDAVAGDARLQWAHAER